ncbi:hypothetical protein [Metabacillus arenae]|uniref:Uncharacterized protein n=1 Tax=Metabacillus arenae TaxID=2771434 RepID=A0A926NR64_9BACI|nr:hypothetical protein [Metabacillus arenae]MBD1382416.1 hypothetical protein [Metabacillus arenae]
MSKMYAFLPTAMLSLVGLLMVYLQTGFNFTMDQELRDYSSKIKILEKDGNNNLIELTHDQQTELQEIIKSKLINHSTTEDLLKELGVTSGLCGFTTIKDRGPYISIFLVHLNSVDPIEMNSIMRKIRLNSVPYDLSQNSYRC